MIRPRLSSTVLEGNHTQTQQSPPMAGRAIRHEAGNLDQVALTRFPKIRALVKAENSIFRQCDGSAPVPAPSGGFSQTPKGAVMPTNSLMLPLANVIGDVVSPGLGIPRFAVAGQN
jgi:hypothetical protein